MRHRHLLFLLMLLPGTTRAASTATPDIDVATLRERATAAIGGADALRALRNVDLELAIDEGGQSYRAHYRATRDGRMRIDVFVGDEGVFREGLDARGAWEQAGADGDVQDVGEPQRQALAHGIDYKFANLWLPAHGSSVEAAGRERIAGVDYHVAKLRLADGFETLLFVNPATWRIERKRDVRAYHPSNDAKEVQVESASADWQPLCGVAFARTSSDHDLSSGGLLATQRIVSARCNVEESTLDIERPR
ncbi:MAG TPA: hypothetical protein VFL14_15385 [Xanthomonadales bacterium]|nr:hypothetical protein [Xanthomonadales bacterium]